MSVPWEVALRLPIEDNPPRLLPSCHGGRPHVTDIFPSNSYSRTQQDTHKQDRCEVNISQFRDFSVLYN